MEDQESLRYPSSAVSGPCDELELSVVIPCLNEAETLGKCIEKAQKVMCENDIRGEIIIADNGSVDGSQEIAERMGASVVHVPEKGYGSALQGGIAAAKGKYVIMGDADDSYDFLEIPRFMEKLDQGYELVMGNRFRGEIKPGAMPFLHRYFGNPVLSSLGRLFFRSVCSDFHCGMRGFNRNAILALNLHTTGMEFASEMVVSATLYDLRTTEVPITLWPDGRSRPPHLRSWRDGWRHLRFLLMYSPRWLFLYPGVVLMLLGVMLMAWLLPGPRYIGNVVLDLHTLLYAAAMVWLGFQAVLFGVLSKVFALTNGLAPWTPPLQRMFQRVSLEAGLIVGTTLALLGLGGAVATLVIWGKASFGPLEVDRTMRLAIPAVLSVALGCQTIFSSFFLSILGLKRKDEAILVHESLHHG